MWWDDDTCERKCLQKPTMNVINEICWRLGHNIGHCINYVGRNTVCEYDRSWSIHENECEVEVRKVGKRAAKNRPFR